MDLITIFAIFLFYINSFSVLGQYNQCLRPIGCYQDECCFNIVPKTGDVCYPIPGCQKNFARDCCKNSRPVNTPYGLVYGYAILLDDEYSFREDGKRYLQIWLGVQYAKPPTRENHLRFKRPSPPDRSAEKYDATFYRPACPQRVERMAGLIRKDRSEDCLYMNIFVVNQTIGVATHMQRYPILLFLHGGEHSYGSPVRYPGHILAQQNIMVVTVQYRLNAFGFLSTDDRFAQGNYGLWDQLQALLYLRAHADRFLGDPHKITLVGHGSGAGDVALHMMSDLSGMRKPTPLFHRAIWMSGSDLMVGGFATQPDEGFRYAYQLAIRAGCTGNNEEIVNCLSMKSADELAGAASQVQIHEPDWLGRPWSPTVDHKFINDTPINLRQRGYFAKIPVIGGITTDEGSSMVEEFYGNISQGWITEEEYRKRLIDIAQNDFAQSPDAVADSIQFEYTYWPNPDNDTWRLQSYRDLYSDWLYGSGLDYSLKFQSDISSPRKNMTQMYVFKYRSAGDPKTRYMGAYQGSELQYVFGFPYFNATNWTSLGLEDPGFYYRDLDRNMTDYMMYMFSNFVMHGNATPDIIRNFTWDTYRPENRTYFLLDLHYDFEYGFDLKQDYHVYHYGFWQNFYPLLLQQLPRFSTPLPTPAYLEEYRTSSISIAGILIVVLIVFFALLIVYVRRRNMLTK